MTQPLARFAVVGSLVTAVDVGTFVALNTTDPVVADLVALDVATATSYVLHRQVTFREDPYDRWLERRREFVTSALVGATVDLAIVRLASRRTSPVAAKLAAVAVAGAVRWTLHRRVLFSIVRSDAVPRPDRPSAPGAVRLSVVIPAYQEADRIAAVIKDVRRALSEVEIVVVDDGSTDGTADAARLGGADLVLVHPRNRGKGAAVRDGVLAASGRTIAFTDADLAYAPEQILGLVDQVEAGWDIVVGSRKHEGTRTLVRAGRLREIGGRVINWFTHAVVLGHYRDTQCGLKAFRADVARTVFERSRVDGFAFDIEVFVIAERNRMALTEVPVTVTNTTRSTVNVARDAARLVRDLFRIRRWSREGAYQVPANVRRMKGSDAAGVSVEGGWRG